ncbi:lipopolysaccharide biosynthesis protein [bacterium]|nr:lipopolysaccharide biosynthesis protein [bacterium]
MQPEHEGLTRKVVRGGAWVFGLNLVSRGLKLVRTIILARLLLPSDFGMVGIAEISISLLGSFSGIGFGQAIVQKKGCVTEYLDTAWCVLVIRGIILAALLFFGAPFIAGFFKTTAAIPVLRVMTITLVLTGFSNIGTTYFEKDLQFKKLFIYNLGSTIASLVVGISLAFILRNVWAIIYGTLAGAVTSLFLSYILHPYRPKFRFELEKLKELFGFGKWILISTVVVFLITQGDDILTGRLLGIGALGLYAMAYRLSNLTATEITHVISRVTFPAYSKLQHDISKLREGYLKVLQFTAFVSFPLACGIFILAPDFTRIFLGSKWMPMVPAMQVLSFFGLLRSMSATTAPVFWGVGKPGIETKWNIAQLVVLSAVIYPFIMHWNILGTSIAVFISILVSTIGFSFMVIKITGCRIRDFARAIGFPLVNTIVIFLLVSFLKTFISIGIIEFFAVIFVSILVYLGVAYLLDKFLNYGIYPLMKESLNYIKNEKI